MLAIHPNARTTPVVRAEIARSSEGASVLARRYGVSAETIRKWHERGPDACQDRSARPHKLHCVPATRSAPSYVRSAVAQAFLSMR